MKALLKVLDRPIAFHRAFVDLQGKNGRLGVTGALMLSQALYWAQRTDDPDGWFYKSIQEWEQETGLTRTEQETARRRLRGTAFWHEERRGVPARMYYRVDMGALAEALGLGANKFAENPQSSLQDSCKQECRNPANINKNTETTTETTTYAADAARAPTLGEQAQGDKRAQEPPVEEKTAGGNALNSAPPAAAPTGGREDEYKQRILAAMQRGAARRAAELEQVPGFDPADWPEPVRGLAKAFIAAAGFGPASKSERKFWLKTFEQMASQGVGTGDVKAAVARMRRDGLTIKGPQSVLGVARDIAAQRRTERPTATRWKVVK